MFTVRIEKDTPWAGTDTIFTAVFSGEINSMLSMREGRKRSFIGRKIELEFKMGRYVDSALRQNKMELKTEEGLVQQLFC